MISNSDNYRVVFIGGAHRSGTTPLYRLLGSSNRISIFSNTGATEDEGLYLQTAYPVGIDDGICTFALDPQAHWTENSPYIEMAKARLFAEWSRHWDLKRTVLAEKTPANLIRSRMLQAVFPNARFLFIMRHPVAAIMASVKWTKSDLSLDKMMQNWINAHEYMLEDLPYVQAHTLKYEEFTSDPAFSAPAINKLLDIDTTYDFRLIKPGLNDKYFDNWRSGEFHLWSKSNIINRIKMIKNQAVMHRVEDEYEKRLNKFGYSFSDVYKK